MNVVCSNCKATLYTKCPLCGAPATESRVVTGFGNPDDVIAFTCMNPDCEVIEFVNFPHRVSHSFCDRCRDVLYNPRPNKVSEPSADDIQQAINDGSVDVSDYQEPS